MVTACPALTPSHTVSFSFVAALVSLTRSPSLLEEFPDLACSEITNFAICHSYALAAQSVLQFVKLFFVGLDESFSETGVVPSFLLCIFIAFFIGILNSPVNCILSAALLTGCDAKFFPEDFLWLFLWYRQV